MTDGYGNPMPILAVPTRGVTMGSMDAIDVRRCRAEDPVSVHSCVCRGTKRTLSSISWGLTRVAGHERDDGDTFRAGSGPGSSR